jgi:hypothetical protein
VQYFTLTNALITDVALSTHEMPRSDADKGVRIRGGQVDLSKIEWTWNNGGITATDFLAACI